jgi:transposase
LKRARLTEEQIIAVLKEHEAGAKTADLARRHGISEATIYSWKAKFGGMDVSEAPSGINRIYRLYREEGLTVRKRRARRKAAGTRAPILVEAKPNARWSLDFSPGASACSTSSMT